MYLMIWKWALLTTYIKGEDTVLTMTIQEALDGSYNTTNHCLYLYRDEDVIFYVGRSTKPLDRMLEHMGLVGRSTASQLGNVILDNLPISSSWKLDLYTLADCTYLVESYQPAHLPHYLEILAGKDSYVEQLTSKRTALESRIISESDWREMCEKKFNRYIYDLLGDDVEQLMIDHYSPYLNVMGKHSSNSLPDRYVKTSLRYAESSKVANQGVKLTATRKLQERKSYGT